MKRYEILVGILFVLSFVLKLGSVFALCHTPLHIDETAHVLHPQLEKKERTRGEL